MSKPDDRPAHPANAAPTATGKEAPSDQDVRDEALDQTFPASDPIAPGAARRASDRIATDKYAVDRQLEPGSKSAPQANVSAGPGQTPKGSAADRGGAGPDDKPAALVASAGKDCAAPQAVGSA